RSLLESASHLPKEKRPMSAEYAVTLSKFQLGDMLVEYILAVESQIVGLRLYPASMVAELAARRELSQTFEVLLQPKSNPPMRAWQVESLAQVKLIGDAVSGYAQGSTMRNSETVASLCYAGQEVLKNGPLTEIVTSLRSERGYACEHHLMYREVDESLTIRTDFRNEGTVTLTLEMLASFSLSGLTPCAEDDAPNRLFLHSFRSHWSAEGRHHCESVEDLGLESSWSTHAIRAERFGQVGSMPVRDYFPFIGMEDRVAGV